MKNEAGEEMPIKQRWGEMGGIYSRELLSPGKAWRTKLQMKSFITLPVGVYTVRIQYDDSRELSNEMKPEGLIVFYSKPIKLTVNARIIELSKKEKDDALACLSHLDSQAPLQIIAGNYDPKAYGDFIGPDTPAGQLLALGWKAVPVLIDTLESKDGSGNQCAWILALLFTITGQNDPRDAHGVLASYEYVEGGWDELGGMKNEDPSGGFGCGSKGSSMGGAIDADTQRRFAEKWTTLRKCFTIKNK